jgi:predicted nucleic acid-binding protein
MLLLDTNVISELRKKPRYRHPAVLAWSRTAIKEEAFLCSLTVEELENGALLRQRKDPVQARRLWDWLHNEILHDYAGRILSFDVDAALMAASFHIERTHPASDARIAAVAKVNNLTLATRNIRDFLDLPISVLNPFDYKD